MKQSDFPDFAVLISDVMAFYRQDVSEFAMSVWWEACKSYDLEQVRKALTSHAMDPERGQFPPKPADLVRALHGTHTDRALLAWNRAYKAISEYGMYQSPNLGDEVAHAVVLSLGGWPKFCQSPIDEMPFLQKRFCDAYRTFSTRGGVELPSRLLGMSDIENRAKGYFLETEAEKPLLN